MKTNGEYILDKLYLVFNYNFFLQILKFLKFLITLVSTQYLDLNSRVIVLSTQPHHLLISVYINSNNTFSLYFKRIRDLSITVDPFQLGNFSQIRSIMPISSYNLNQISSKLYSIIKSLFFRTKKI